MQRPGPLDVGAPQPGVRRGTADPVPRSTPLTIVSRVVAGDDLHSVAASTSQAIGHPVVIAIPALGEPVAWPPGSLAADQLAMIAAYAGSVVGEGGSRGRRRGRASAVASDLVADSVVVCVGSEVVGIVGAVAVGNTSVAGGGGAGAGERREEAASADLVQRRAWLEGAAAAAAVTAVMRKAGEQEVRDGLRTLLLALEAAPPSDPAAMVDRGRRLELDLSRGAVAVCARGARPEHAGALAQASLRHRVALSEVDSERVLGLVPLADGWDATRDAVTAELTASGMTVACSAPRTNPAGLHAAVREAALLAELACVEPTFAEQEETYRLLIGVWLTDAAAVQQLHRGAIAPLDAYDAQHDAELVGTLRAFLDHHGSTSDTADALGLHRHTVGYRLTRVHEVSGLSPYESHGRERLSLGLKAARILAADARRAIGDRPAADATQNHGPASAPRPTRRG